MFAMPWAQCCGQGYSHCPGRSPRHWLGGERWHRGECEAEGWAGSQDKWVLGLVGSDRRAGGAQFWSLGVLGQVVPSSCPGWSHRRTKLPSRPLYPPAPAFPASPGPAETEGRARTTSPALIVLLELETAARCRQPRWGQSMGQDSASVLPGQSQGHGHVCPCTSAPPIPQCPAGLGIQGTHCHRPGEKQKKAPLWGTGNRAWGSQTQTPCPGPGAPHLAPPLHPASSLAWPASASPNRLRVLSPQIRRRRPTPATLVLSSDQSSPGECQALPPSRGSHT